MSKAKTTPELAHSHIGASSMERWATCPGSVRMSRGLKSVESKYAAEGTAAHELAKNILECELAGQPFHYEQDDIDPETLEAVKVYTDEVLSDAKGNDVLVEEKCDLSQVHPGLFGTCDNITFVKAKKLLKVRDYKHGSGIAVEVKGNKQLRYYGLAALLSTDFPCEAVELTIVQPRCNHPDGPIRSERIASLELLEFSEELKNAALATEKPDAPLVPGDHCRFCPAAGICPAIRAKAQDLAALEFADVPGQPISVDELAKALEWVPVVKQWAENVDKFAYTLAQKGTKIPGHKLVAKRAVRKWTNETEVSKFLEREFTPTMLRSLYDDPTLKSVAQMEKILHENQWPKLAPFISKISSGEALVPESDKRPEVKILDVNEAFDQGELID
jgi:hypothetical protein